MPTLEVMPRPTPQERADTEAAIDVDELLAGYAESIDEWITPRQQWEFTLHEGHDFGRANNVEGRLVFVAGEQTSSLSFRLDQVARVEDTGEQLLLLFEEMSGIAKLARCTATGLEIELFHILTFT
jgi:hypothetical protein